MNRLRNIPLVLLMAGIVGYTVLVACSDDTSTDPNGEPPPPIQGSTWLLESPDFAAKGVTNFLITFSPDNLDVIGIQYGFNGTDYTYGETDITGAGSVFAGGRNVNVTAEWTSTPNTVEFEGILTSSNTEAVGAVGWAITEGSDTEAGGGQGKITKQ